MGGWVNFRVSFVACIKVALAGIPTNSLNSMSLEIKCIRDNASRQPGTEARAWSKQSKLNLKSALGNGKQPFETLT